MRVARSLFPLVFLLGLGAAQSQAQNPAAPAETRDFRVRLEISTNPDGGVSAVDVFGPSAPVNEIVRKEVLRWRFSPSIWEGRPAARTFQKFLSMQAVPTTSGGYALRTLGFDNNAYQSMEYAPPMISGKFTAVRSEVLYAYSATVAPDGKLVDIVRLSPRKHPSQGSYALERIHLATLSGWKQHPVIVNGAPVRCQRLYVVQHLPNRLGVHADMGVKGWSDEIRIDDAHAELRQAVDALEAGLATPCALPELQTPIDGTLLH